MPEGRVAKPRGRLDTSARRAARKVLQLRRRWLDRAERREPTGIDVMGLGATEPIGDLARRLDLGSRELVTGQTYRYDVRRADVARLLVSAASAARDRHQRLTIHTGGQLVRVDRVPRRLITTVSRSGRARLLVSDGRNRLVENICIDVWRQARDGSWRTVASDAPITRIKAPSGTPTEADPRHVDSVPDFPIDAVYTWVNAADPAWRAQFSQYQDLTSLDPERFVPLDELRYSLRSLDMFAPWIRRIHIFTNCAPPGWFVPSDRVRWVDHSAAIPRDYLPLFHSGAIETFLHRIPELSEHFIYLNDDFLLASSVFPATFFTGDGRPAAFLSRNTSTLFLEQLVNSNTAKEFHSGRVNGSRLLQDHFGTFPTLILRHAPYAFTTAGWQTLEATFPAEIEATRRARFRSHAAIAWAAYLYAQFALLSGTGIVGTARQYKISPDNIQGLLGRQELGLSPRREFANVAPSGQAPYDPVFTSSMSSYFRRQWPFPSGAERGDSVPSVGTTEVIQGRS